MSPTPRHTSHQDQSIWNGHSQSTPPMPSFQPRMSEIIHRKTRMHIITHIPIAVEVAELDSVSEARLVLGARHRPSSVRGQRIHKNRVRDWRFAIPHGKNDGKTITV